MGIRQVAYAMAGSAMCAVAVASCGTVAQHTDAKTAPPLTPIEAISFAHSLRTRVAIEGVLEHLSALQDIADNNNHTRAAGTSGFDQSVEYVAKALKDKGFDVNVPEYDFKYFDIKSHELTVGAKKVDSNVLGYSPGGNVRGRLVPALDGRSTGCSGADYDGLDVKGAAVLLERGACSFANKEQIAAERGALALIITDNVHRNDPGGTLGPDATPRIPVLTVTKSVGEDLRAHPDPVELTVDAQTTIMKARNVIAQTKTGSPSDVVMAGAHLDSARTDPGINDNGTGVAAVLQTALQMGPTPEIKNAVRFAFWGAQQQGLAGSTNYIKSLRITALKDIALYLNYDMLGSPNAGFMTYDGDQSTEPSPDSTPTPIPEGSAGIERTEVAYLAEQGKKAYDTPYDGRSDYDAFTKAGIPTGGIFSGAEAIMSTGQARDWGAKANEPFAPNYHQAADTLANVNKNALAINVGAVAYTIGLYSQSIDGRDGVPARDIRIRHQLKDNG